MIFYWLSEFPQFEHQSKIDRINFNFRTRSSKWPRLNYLVFGEGIKSTQIFVKALFNAMQSSAELLRCGVTRTPLIIGWSMPTVKIL
jgi:hypothetical protein